MSDHTADLLVLQHWRARAAELEHERDAARAEIERLREERDEALSLLRECRGWVEVVQE